MQKSGTKPGFLPLKLAWIHNDLTPLCYNYVIFLIALSFISRRMTANQRVLLFESAGHSRIRMISTHLTYISHLEVISFNYGFLLWLILKSRLNLIQFKIVI